jgi:hypothetical protein
VSTSTNKPGGELGSQRRRTLFTGNFNESSCSGSRHRRSGNPETGGQSCEMFRRKSKLREIKAFGRQHFMFLACSSGRQINKQSSSFQASANNVPDKYDILWRTVVEPLEFPPVGAQDWACITWALFIRNIQMKP